MSDRVLVAVLCTNPKSESLESIFSLSGTSDAIFLKRPRVGQASLSGENSQEAIQSFQNRMRAITSTRNEARDFFLSGDWSHLFFVDDDVVVPPDALEKLQSVQADLVGGLVPARASGNPSAFVFPDSKQPAEYVFAQPGSGPQAVDVVSAACLLIRRVVLEKTRFSFDPRNQVANLETKTLMPPGEDYEFCVSAKARGFSIAWHPGVICKHLLD